MSHENEADNPVENTAPFKIEIADRVKRLPPYLFGRINALQVPQAAGRRRRDRPGHGQPVAIRPRIWSSTSWPRRPAIRATTATAVATASPTCAARWPPSTSSKFGVRLDPDERDHRHASARRKASATCAWPCWGPATRRSSRRRTFPIHVYAVALAVGQRHRARSAPTAKSSCRTSPTPASTCTRGRSC